MKFIQQQFIIVVMIAHFHPIAAKFKKVTKTVMSVRNSEDGKQKSNACINFAQKQKQAIDRFENSMNKIKNIEK
jgi:hypothetical protein